MARSSSYGNYLNRLGGIPVKMPNWVMGSDFGELQAQLAEADNAQWKSDFNRQQLIQNELQTGALQDRARYEDILTEEMRRGNPTSLRDAYQIALNAAQQGGSGNDILDLTAKLEKMDREDRLGKFSNIQQAAQFGRIDPALADEYLQTVGTDYKFKPGAFAKEPKREVQVMDPATGNIAKVSWTDALLLQQRGAIVDPTNEMREDVLRSIRRQQREAEQESGGSWNPLGFFTGDSASNSGNEPQNAAGDRSVNRPAPGDEVRLIIKNRTSQNKSRAPRG